MTAEISDEIRGDRPHAGQPVVVARQVSKVFSNGVRALDDISFTVQPGEFLSLLGPSGCGKSTALRIIAGLAAPSSGTIEWPASGQPQSDRRDQQIGFVFQEPTLLPWATVFSNVYLPLRLKGFGRDQAKPRIMAMLEAVGLADFAGAYPRELSGGMKMRVSIARELVARPTLLLLDEPFAALDEITRHRLNDDLLRLWQESGVTVVFVTHSVFESVYLSTRIAVMTGRPGRIHEEIPVQLPAERDANFRTSEPYRAIADRVSRALQDAMQSGDGP